MLVHKIILLTILVCLSSAIGLAANEEIETQVIFKQGEDGYHTYRIPSLNVTKSGVVLAFCEGRVSRGDSGDIDIVLKRSVDNGNTWGEQQVVWSDGENTCGNPCSVVDNDTGIVWLLMTHNLGEDHESHIINGDSKGSRTVWVTCSRDEGESWEKPLEITSEVKKGGWTWYATGPGAGIQLTTGGFKGRLVIPCDHIDKDKKCYSHIIFSDDHGKSWQLGGSTPQDKVNECEVAELSDGRLLLNMRNYDRKIRNRAISISDDGGTSWSQVKHDEKLIEPICQGSIRKYFYGDDYFLLFSNPASKSSRINMMVRLSKDDCMTWPYEKVLYAGPSAYSSLAVLSDRTVGCLYERGDKSPYESIAFARFSLQWLQGD